MSKKKILIIGAIALVVIISIVIIITASGSKNTKRVKNVLLCNLKVRFNLPEYGSTYYEDSQFFTFENSKISKISDVVIIEPEINSLNLYKYLNNNNNTDYRYNYSYDSINNRIIGKYGIINTDDLFNKFFNQITGLDIHSIDRNNLIDLLNENYICGWEYE